MYLNLVRNQTILVSGRCHVDFRAVPILKAIQKVSVRSRDLLDGGYRSPE